MNALAIILNIVLILISIVLIAVVLMQQGQRQGLGAIGGGAETFLGKNAASTVEGKLKMITKIAAAAFIVLAIVATMISGHISAQETAAQQAELEALLAEAEAAAAAEAEATEGEEAAEETAADTAEETAADTTEETAADTTEEAADTTEDAADTTEEAATTTEG